MKKIEVNLKNRLLTPALFLICFLFALSVFKNIAYPLLWNDEAETAMFAARILDYGYPKVHDGKNVVNMLELPDNAGTDEKTDAYTGTSAWGQYYFGCIGAFFAKNTTDIYTKTFLLRIPFAIIGFAGVIIMAALTSNLFKRNPVHKAVFFILFIFLELISISLILHIREARYYSLIIFLSACIFYIYFRHKFIKKMPGYIPFMVLLLWAVFNVFPPAYFAFIITIGLHECLRFCLLKKARASGFMADMAPLLVSFVLIIPLLIFFRTFHISREFSVFFHFRPGMYYSRIFQVFNFFQKYEFLNIVIFIKAVLISLCFYYRKFQLSLKLEASNFLTLFFIIYILVISRMPLYVIYQRYYIALQPVLAAILLLDFFIMFEFMREKGFFARKRNAGRIFLFLMCAVFLLNCSNKAGDIKNHIYELFHRYRGPLDFAIPFIKAEFRGPENLIIATNYEECAYMYYLGSKTVCGYVGNNIKEDLKERPDIIIIRKKWSYVKPEEFDIFFKNDRYKKISFPVFDYPVNNIPEIGQGGLVHLYKTKLSPGKDKCLDMYIKS